MKLSLVSRRDAEVQRLNVAIADAREACRLQTEETQATLERVADELDRKLATRAQKELRALFQRFGSEPRATAVKVAALWRDLAESGPRGPRRGDQRGPPGVGLARGRAP